MNLEIFKKELSYNKQIFKKEKDNSLFGFNIKIQRWLDPYTCDYICKNGIIYYNNLTKEFLDCIDIKTLNNLVWFLNDINFYFKNLKIRFAQVNKFKCDLYKPKSK